MIGWQLIRNHGSGKSLLKVVKFSVATRIRSKIPALTGKNGAEIDVVYFVKSHKISILDKSSSL